ncbi:MAG: hypothetical protein GXP62_04245 [Oligoflexia bacterium]|nr:hypothetical protein [Oligoflexia bacterium]
MSTWPTRTRTQIVTAQGQDLHGEAILIQLDDATVIYQLNLPVADRRRLEAEALA